MKNIPLFKVRMNPAVGEAVTKVLNSGFVGEGPAVKAFENAVCEAHDLPWTLATNSCTSALQLALRLSNVGPGDVVLTTPATNMATNSVILAAGATPVWVDVEPETGKVNPKTLPKEPPKNTKALMVMDWGGSPCDLDALLDYTKKHNIKLIEDAAQAFGSLYKNEFLGRKSDFTCYSFGPIKSLTTVDGGMLICKNAEDHERGKRLRWFGIDRSRPTDKLDPRCTHPIEEYGMKWHMTDVAATIGLENLNGYEETVGRVIENASFYSKKLTLLNTSNILPMAESFIDTVPIFWLYTIRILKNRDEFAQALLDRGIAVSKVHSRNDRHPCMPMTKDGDLPGVDEFYRTQLCIPVGWWLSDDDCDFIVESILDCARIVK